MQGYEGRAKGTFYTDSGVDGEWFNGVPYNGSHNYWQVGFDETGGQAEYQANTKLTVRDNGNVGIGTTSPENCIRISSAQTLTLNYKPIITVVTFTRSKRSAVSSINI